MNRRLKQNLRVAMLGLIVLSFFVRVLIPAGFMPAAWTSDGPFVICPDGLFNFEAALATGHGDHSQHSGHGKHGQPHGDSDSDKSISDGIDAAEGHISYELEFCPIGSALGAATAPAFDAGPVIVFVPTRFTGADFSPRFSSTYLSLYHARGPPQAPQVYA